MRRSLPGLVGRIARLLAYFVLIGASAAHATHFRGGSITWQAVDLDNGGTKNDVLITVKTAWRYDSINSVTLATAPAFPVAMTQVSNNIIYVNGTASGADYALQTTIFKANNLNPATSYLVNYTGSARISNLRNNADGSWNIQTTIYMNQGNLAPKIDLPIIFEIPQQQAGGGGVLTNFTFPIGSTDPNADKLRYRLANATELGTATPQAKNPDGLALNPNTGTLTWTGSGAMTAGLYSGGVVAEDLDEAGAVKSKTHVDFILSLVNKAAVAYTHPANIPETNNVIVKKGTTFSFAISGTAIETQSLGNLQGALVDMGSGAFAFTPGAVGDAIDLVPGSYPITFEIRDTTHTASNSYLVVNFIVPDPLAPAIEYLEGDRTVYAATASQLIDQNLDAVVTDADNVHLNGGRLKFNVTFVDGQSEVLAIQSTGTGTGQISRTGSDIFYEGKRIGIVSSTLDGVGRALEIRFTTNDATIDAAQALVRALTYEDTFALRPVGDRRLSVYVEDQTGRSNSYNFFVNVAAHPDRGTVSGAPVVAANTLTLTRGPAGQAQAIALSNENVSFADPEGDTITLTASNVQHGHFALVSASSTPITSFTQAQVDLGAIAFVHDGSDNAPAWDLTASDGTNSSAPSTATILFSLPNVAPLISGTPSTSIPVGSAYSFTPTVTDTPPYTFSANGNLPAWASINTNTGAVTGTPPASANGVTYNNIVITVTDGGGLSASLPAFAITVTAPVDTDGDGVPDYVENAATPPTNPNDPTSYPDADNDGVPDYVEGQNGTDPDDPRDYLDSDDDGVPDYVEARQGTNPHDPTSSKDTDGDGVPDYVETKIDNTDPNDKRSFKDSDADGVSDYHERHVDNTNPGDGNSFVDSDGDGVPDYVEGLDGTDPNDPNSANLAIRFIDATGLFTPVSQARLIELGLMTAGDAARCCGNYAKAADGSVLFPPGRNLITWSGKGKNVLNVNPLVSMGPDSRAAEGAPSSFSVLLNGKAPVYPLTVAYTVGGTADSADHNLVSGTVTFNSGETRKDVAFLVNADGFTEGDETIVVTLAGSPLNAGSKRSQIVTIREGNSPPTVTLQPQQNGAPAIVIGRNAGPVVVTAAVQDLDAGDTHSYDWQGTSNVLVDTDGNVSTVTFDPAGVAPGLYEVKVKVMDNGSPAASAKASLYLRVVDERPVLSGSVDSDGDGIPDALEGFGDSDGDGIPDYLDAFEGSNVLPEMAADRRSYLIECEPGVACRLGAFAMLGESGGTRLVDGDFQKGLVGSRDPDFDNVGGIFDFVARVEQAGQSLLIAVPQRAAIPAGAVYRKQGADGKWTNFVENETNRLYSAPGRPGYCPPPGDAAWRAGLNAGDWCVQLQIQDGGRNDMDGAVDGFVVDPGGVGVAAKVDYATDGGGKRGGGGGGAAGLDLLALLGAAGLGLGLSRSRARRALAPALAAGALIAAAGSNPAQAEDHHQFYVSARVGSATTDVSRGDLERDFAKQRIAATVTDIDDDRTGYGLTLGYKVAPRWGVEVGYLDLGDVGLKFSANSTAIDLASVHPESGNGITAAVRYRHPLGAGFSAQARLGMFAWEGDYWTDRGGLHVDRDSESATDPFWGLGVSYELGSHVDVDVEFQRFEFERQPTDFFSVGLQYRFCL